MYLLSVITQLYSSLEYRAYFVSKATERRVTYVIVALKSRCSHPEQIKIVFLINRH